MLKNYGIALASLVLLHSGLAFAHAHLKSSDPAQNAVVAQAPAQITLHFSENLELSLCKLEVKDATSGDIVSLGKLSDGGQGKTTMRVDLKPLKKQKAKYTVSWKAVSADTHRTQGTFDFTYAPQD